MHEELVFDPAIKAAHTKILWEMGHNAGLSKEQIENAVAETSTAASFATLENIARSCHWTVGWIGSSVDEFVLVQMKDHNFQPAKWRETFNLSQEQVFFFEYHLTADLEHAGKKVWAPMQPYVNDEVKAEILRTLPLLMEAHRLFYCGVESQALRLEQGG